MMKPLSPPARSTSALLLIGALLQAPVAFAAQPPEEEATSSDPGSPARTDRAREFFERGTAAWDAKKFEEARALFEEAWQLSRSYDVAAGLGQAELKLGRHRDAAQHLHHAVRSFPVGANRLLLAGLEQKLAEARRHVGVVRISVDEPGAHVLVDGIDVGVVPPDGYLFVEPGERKVRALHEGMPSALEIVQVQPDQEQSVTLTILRDSPPAEPRSEAQPRSEATAPLDEGARDKSWVPVYVGAGVALVGLGAWVGFGVDARDARSDAAAYRDQTGDTGCSTGAAGADVCTAGRDAFDRQRHSALWSHVGLGVGVAAGLGAVAYLLFWPSEPQEQRSTFRLRPSFAGDRAGGVVGVDGTF